MFTWSLSMEDDWLSVRHIKEQEILIQNKTEEFFGKGELPPGGRRKGAIEMYESTRYFTMTGDHLIGTPKTIEERNLEKDNKAWPKLLERAKATERK